MFKVVVGKKTLDNLTVSMYKDARIVFREYIQNATDAIDDAMAQQLCELAQVPLSWEVQFDIFPDGHIGDVLSIDLCLPLAKTTRIDEFFADGGRGAQAMRVLTGWGVSDERWRRIPQACFARLAWPRGEEGAFLLRCHPAFIKAKWHGTTPQPAKVYLEGTARPVG